MRNHRPRTLRYLAGALVLGTLAPVGPARGGTVFPGATWSSTTPEAADLDGAKLAEVAALVGGSGVIVRHGQIVYEWGGGGTTTGDWASASKPMLSTLLFLATDQGSTGIHTTMGEVMTGASPKDAAITFFHLANMISGYSRSESAGAAFAYNDHAINLYGYALCHEVFGRAPSDVVATEFAFLQFQDSPTINDSQYGRISVMSIRDFARLGLFWLNRGTWDGNAVIPAASFDLVTNQVPVGIPLSADDGAESWNLGSFGGSDDQVAPGPGNYGMNFWVNTNGLWPSVPANVYAAIGRDGQKTCMILPDQDMVAVGLGSWGPLASGNMTSAILKLIEADTQVAVEVQSWSRIKAAYRKE